MKNELISMVDFVLGQDHPDNLELTEFEMAYCSGYQYANFLNTPLNISMFVPAIKVGDKWEVLEIPESGRDSKFQTSQTSIEVQIYFDDLWIRRNQYQTAKEQCLFEGLNIESVERLLLSCDIVEDLMDNYYRYVTLTKKGLEVSGLNNK